MQISLQQLIILFNFVNFNTSYMPCTFTGHLCLRKLYIKQKEKKDLSLHLGAHEGHQYPVTNINNDE